MIKPKLTTVVRSDQPTSMEVADDGTPQIAREITPDAIRISAYRRWELAGMPPGDGIPFWLEAERDLIQRALGAAESLHIRKFQDSTSSSRR